jgi:ankyrin repeat protein
MDEEVYRMLKEKRTGDLLRWLSEDRSRISYTDSNGVSLLLLSFYFGNRELSDFIVSARKPVDIFEAVVAGDPVAVEKMLDESPAVINSFSADGFTPLGFAAYFSRVQIAGLLLSRGASPHIPSRNSFAVYPLHSAVAANCGDIVRMLLENGASPNVRQQKDITPLHSAAHNANVAIARLLISHGADTQVVTSDGKTVLDMAEEAKAADIVNLIKNPT